VISAGEPCWGSARVSGETRSGRLEAGGPGSEADGLCARCRLRVVWDGGVGSGRTEDWDRVVVKAFGSDVLSCDDRMLERAIVMFPRAVAGLCGWFFRIISAVRIG
jgi:hypothetical protein